jgi:hypothetical protein
MQATWNTGRGYSENGQVITAVYLGGDIHYAVYVDHTRGLDGHFAMHPEFPIESIEQLQRMVMRHYDRVDSQVYNDALELEVLNDVKKDIQMAYNLTR